MSEPGRFQPGGALSKDLPSHALQVLFRGVRILHKGCRDGNGEPSACWIWTRGCDKDGYPRVKLSGKDLYAHRVTYAIFHQDFDLEYFDVHHLCEVRGCINPHHLEKRSSWGHRAGEGDVPF